MDDAVEGQLRAYNEHDADRFADCYAENVVIEDASRVVLMSGREQVREWYRSFFQRAPRVHADVVTRIRLRSYVIDEERATNTPRGDVHAVVIYRVGPDGLIDHVLFLQ